MERSWDVSDEMGNVLKGLLISLLDSIHDQ